MEVWKSIKGYENSYKVSSLGNVVSIERKDSLGRPRKEKILTVDLGKNGYTRVTLFKNAKRNRCLVHRLVAEAFIPNPNNLPQVNHINGKKNDNRAENLEWVNASENAKHAYKTGLSKPKTGKASGLSKAILQYSNDGVFIRRWEATMEVERKLKISHAHVSKCCKGKQKTAGGFIWRYEDEKTNSSNKV